MDNQVVRWQDHVRLNFYLLLARKDVNIFTQAKIVMICITVISIGKVRENFSSDAFFVIHCESNTYFAIIFPVLA
jgi:hypothetical protein